jgi:hypothetical protein
VNVLTPEERLRHIDQTVDEVKQEFVDLVQDGFGAAIDELSQSDEVDPAFQERLASIGDRLATLPSELEPSVFEIEQLHELHTTLHQTRDLMEELKQDARDRLNTLNELLIRIEVIRHIVRDAIDEHVTGISSDAAEVITQLKTWLPNTPQREFARLVDVDRRTLARWALQHGRPRRRLQLVAQLVAILRHSWTEEGVIAWFARPNYDLGNRKPISLLGDAGMERDLLMAARATRTQYGT